jgi:hypothetical protein
MAQDIDKALGQLQDMLSTDEGKRDLENMIGAFTDGDEDKSENISPSSMRSNPLSGFNLDSMFGIRSVLDGLQAGDDSRANLLNALKPYLSQSRHSHVDNAIKIMHLGKLPNLLKNLKK